ncbi:hypothetical protein VNO77_42000 [Canavalia gladiata]|uniref:Uncharacterized protein n=1 Tax=Canavalia gladiata TaxID=3824 RepID=A0AAN9K1N9_CANGL
MPSVYSPCCYRHALLEDKHISSKGFPIRKNGSPNLYQSMIKAATIEMSVNSNVVKLAPICKSRSNFTTHSWNFQQIQPSQDNINPPYNNQASSLETVSRTLLLQIDQSCPEMKPASAY